APAPAADPGRPARPRRKAAPAVAEGNALFEIIDAERAVVLPSGTPATLGARVATSSRMADQRRLVRRAPAGESIAALLDGLAQAGGRLTIAEAAALAGEPPVRMSGYLAQVIRLLNVDGYAVLQAKDDGRMVELNQELLRQQFLAG
ncbi:MAG: hypothetical protein ACRDOL_44395, partial [Streptosporangiaceae bacterium]